jgi:predicted ATPase
MLLVLDNCEHLVPEVVAIVQAVLQAAPGVHLLVTSQQVLRVAGERVYRLEPLSLPPPGAPAAQAGAFSAVAMLLERAGAAHHRFALTAQNADDIVALSHHLDGLPLAIEMAAAWLPKLGAHALIERLAEWQRLLRAPTEGMPARQQTLRATLEWSHSLLEPVQQARPAPALGVRRHVSGRPRAPRWRAPATPSSPTSPPRSRCSPR